MTRYGICPVCGGTYSVRKSGLLRVHGYRAYPRGGAECPGSGQPRKGQTDANNLDDAVPPKEKT